MARETIAGLKRQIENLAYQQEQQRRTDLYQANLRDERARQQKREEEYRRESRNESARRRSALRRQAARDAARRGEPAMTPALTAAMRPIFTSQRLSEGMRILAERENEFSSRLAMNLAGIAMIPDAREAFDQALDRFWLSQRGTQPLEWNEIVLGSGVTAAVYCAARVLSGHARPVVLEASERPGGVFAVSRKPSWRLNSPNRPGLGGVPGDESALNYLPGAPIQPSDLSREEYQDNTDISWVTRATLALYGRVFPATAATSYEVESRNKIRVTAERGMFAGRVIDARGTGFSKMECDGKLTLSYQQFMKRMDEPFPLRGMRRVAVVGDGDSAKCVVESLLGISPGLRMTPASLDYISLIDWYGESLPNNCEAWKETQRGRYLRIGAYLRRSGTGPGRERLRVMNKTAQVTNSIGSVLVRERSYDVAIVCIGDELKSLNTAYDGAWDVYGQPRMARKMSSYELYRAGPAADLPFTDRETIAGLASRPSNKVAMFRYTPKTAALGVSLPAAMMPSSVLESESPF